MAKRESALEKMVSQELSFWKGKKVFLTGHTGFKGAWLALLLQKAGAKVCGFSLEPPTQPSLYQLAHLADGMQSLRGDIRDKNVLEEAIQKFAPDIIFHLAAQALVRPSYDLPLETYAINVMGTANLLEIVRYTPSVKATVIITTDKCYENKEWIWGYRENEALGGLDPYSSSKACAELVVTAYRHSFFKSNAQSGLASARAGNVIGGGDWAKDRLVTDLIKSLLQNQNISIRNPQATRPWQHVLEPLSGYMHLAEKLYGDPQAFGEAWNFGPTEEDSRPVEWMVEKLITHFGQGHWELDGKPQPHEAHFLKLDCSKSRQLLGWQPRLGLDQALRWTVDWYKAWMRGEDMRQVTEKQIEAFFGLIQRS